MTRAEPTIDGILSEIDDGARLTDENALRLLQSNDLLTIGGAADRMRWRLHPEPEVTYVIDRNINYTNVCITYCDFCAFYREPGHEEGYVNPAEVIDQKIEEAMTSGATQILLQGGHHPYLKLDYYQDLLGHIKSKYGIHLHAFSPPEIHHIARVCKISIRDTLQALMDAGLGSLPGGGAEIFSPNARDKISPLKCTGEDWLEVMRTAHELGLRSSCTMMFGHVESLEDRVDHFRKLRDLQDETGGFTAFISWTFQPDHTVLKDIPPTGSYEYVKVQAVSRLYLDNVQNVQASWVTQGGKIGQLSLRFGANDFGGTMMEENVVSAAGSTHCLGLAEMRRLIRDAGFEPVQRDFFYEKVEPPFIPPEETGSPPASPQETPELIRISQ